MGDNGGIGLVSGMGDTLIQPRQHPDIFTDAEAVEYLHLASPETLVWLRENFNLPAHRIGKAFMYHREDLDSCAKRMFGKDRPAAKAGQALKIAGASR